MPADAFTISAIMLCIVGAVCFYLYTRIKQTEKKVALMEGILFDLKTAAETGFLGFPAPESLAEDDIDEAESEAEEEFIPILTEDAKAEKAEVDDIAPAAAEVRHIEIEEKQLTFDDAEESEILSEVKSVQVNKLDESGDLESMSVADLATLARSKGITGTSKMRKPQLITAIRGAEVEGVNAESSLLSSSTLMASPL
jgi:hypothetical protein